MKVKGKRKRENGKHRPERKGKKKKEKKGKKNPPYPYREQRKVSSAIPSSTFSRQDPIKKKYMPST